LTCYVYGKPAVAMVLERNINMSNSRDFRQENLLLLLTLMKQVRGLPGN